MINTRKSEMNIQHLINTLPAIQDYDYKDGELVEVHKRPHAFISEDTLGPTLLISGEHGDDLIDYYGDFRGGVPYIHPVVEQWATDNGGYWEWVHPGAISFSV